MTKSIFNFLGTALNTGTQLLCLLLVLTFGDLHQAGEISLAFAIISPIQILAAMAFAPLLISGHPNYQNPIELILSQLLVALPLILMVAVWIAIFAPNFLVLFLLLGGARLLNLAAEIIQATYRRDGAYHLLLLSRPLLLCTFLAFFLNPCKLSDNIATHAAAALFISTALAGIADLIVARRHWSWRRPNLGNCVLLAMNDLGRGGANFLNSIASNIPRYVLHALISASAQAAYSIIVGIARLGTMLMQSALYPRLRHIRNNPRKSLVSIVFISVIMAAFIISLLAVAWLAAAQSDLLKRTNPDLLRVASVQIGLVLLVCSTPYLVRYAIWTAAMILLPVSRQFIISAAAVPMVLFLSTVLAIPFGLIGVASAEAVVNICIVMWVAFSLRKLPRCPHERTY